MWVKLSSQHAARADDTIHQRWQELYDYKYDPENNVTSYINGILSIAYKLREINERTIDNLTQRLVAEEKVIASYEFELKDEETSAAFRAHKLSNRRQRSSHQADGYSGFRENLQNARRGAANRYNTAVHHNQSEQSKVKELECDLCKVDSHKTEDCRKLAKARAILNAEKV